ncbi:hypothetical protein Q7O60_16040 [Pseudomonas protegens]|uniref:hypothetical protein n=1 Tax=Pseudomonas protegens TaxID=380021 RepID=UPI00276E2827|nr:hypothetical protein [Pseudomonas protegens]MDP9504507.1 hypothetical protein [Pseudomonas protegens]
MTNARALIDRTDDPQISVLSKNVVSGFTMMAVSCLLASAITGCGSNQSSRVAHASSATFLLSEKKSGGTPVQLAEDNRKNLEEKLNEVLEFCLPRLSGYEKVSADQATKAYWLSMSGLVAGSVLVPGLAAASASGNAAAIAGLGGWAGATNFAGESLKTSGLSGSTIAQTRNTIIQKVDSAIAVASDGSKTFDERRDALMKARSACILYEISVPTIPQSTK